MRQYYTTDDTNSAGKHVPLAEQARRLTKFVIGNQGYEFNLLFFETSIRPAGFSATMSKIFRQKSKL